MNKNCDVARDLIPLWAEDMLREGSREFLEQHMAECPECRAYAEGVNAEPAIYIEEPSDFLKLINRDMMRKRLWSALMAMAVLLAAVLTVISAMTTPIFLNYQQCPVTAEYVEEDYIVVTVPSSAAEWKLEESFDENGNVMLNVYATNTLRTKGSPTAQQFAYRLSDAEDCTVWFCCPGEENVLILGETGAQGAITLPRLTLGYYAVISAVLFAALMLLWLVFRERKIGEFAAKMAPVPASWAAAHFLIKGLSGSATHTIMRDFGFIAATAACILFAVISYRKVKK